MSRRRKKGKKFDLKGYSAVHRQTKRFRALIPFGETIDGFITQDLCGVVLSNGGSNSRYRNHRK